jgi:hypothetical protein
METITINLIQNPLKRKMLSTFSFDQLFELFKFKKDDYSIGDMALISKVMKKRNDLTVEEREILEGLLPRSYYILSALNPKNGNGLTAIKSMFSREILKYNVEIRKFIESNIDDPEFIKNLDKLDNEGRFVNLFNMVKLSDLVAMVSEDRKDPLVRAIEKNTKYKIAEKEGARIVFYDLKTNFKARNFKSIDDELMETELATVKSLLKGAETNPHSQILLTFLEVNGEENIDNFRSLCRKLSFGLDADYETDFETLCKISGLLAYRDWLRKFIDQHSRVYIDDIDSFNKVKSVTIESISHYLSNGRIELYEDHIQTSIEEILSVPFHKNDWPGEENDLYASSLIFNNHRIASAFLLKGKGEPANTLQIANCGKHGDQIVRLFKSPARLFVIQFVGNISENVIHDVQGKINERRLSGEKVWYCIIDGQDTARLLSAYRKLDQEKTPL